MFGVKVKVATVTVAAAEAVSAGTVPVSLPETTTVWAPLPSVGRLNVHENVPIADVVWEVHVWVRMVPPVMLIEPMAVLTEKPVPATVMAVPTGPALGVRVIPGTVTV